VYKLVGVDGKQVLSETPGTLGGHRKNKIYGRLDCAGAARWIAKGHYVKQRVFFADEATAIAAGYRPCAGCMPAEYKEWKARVSPRGS
jgi:methylphosphotriester-DNA--protein-cysteine methyltransferase